MDDSSNSNDYHQMGRRGHQKNYCWPGTYHITISVANRRQQPLGRIVGDAAKPDGDPQAPQVLLSAVGQMVAQELAERISRFYPMVEVQDYVIMPDHLHCIMVVHSTIVSKNGRVTHLGQVIAGFKKGCNRRYWELLGIGTNGQPHGQPHGQGKPANASNEAEQTQAAQDQATQTQAAQTQAAQDQATQTQTVQTQATQTQATQTQAAQTQAAQMQAAQTQAAQTAQTQAEHSRPAVYPQGYKAPSAGTTGRPPLFAYGYVDVMPLQPGQLERQRQYIRNNPRYRLLRMQNRTTLTAQRGGIDTALTLPALRGYLQRECGAGPFTAATWEHLKRRLLTAEGMVACDSYGNRKLLTGCLLPVVCHRKDAHLFSQQKQRCLKAASDGATLVSARIARGEQEIMNEAMNDHHPIIMVADNGLSEWYHPSEERLELCANDRLLLVTPWQYEYRSAGEQISVAECKAMNCVVQALCRMKDSWWKALTMLVCLVMMLCSCHDSTEDRGVRFQKLDLGKTVNVSCFNIAPNGSIWLGLDGEGLAYRESPAASWLFFNKLTGSLPADAVICSYRDSRDRLWFGSFDQGLFFWDGSNFLVPDWAQQMSYVAGFAEDDAGALWVATLKDGIARIDSTGHAEVLNADNSALETNYVVDLKTFDRQVIYVATGWGLFQLDAHERKISPVVDRQGKALLEKQLVRFLYPNDHDGQLWIGTQQGLYIYDKDTRAYTKLTTAEGLASNYVKAICADRRGNVWVTSDSTLTCITPQADAKYGCRCFRSADGIGDGLFHVRAIDCAPDGTMLFGSSKGCMTAREGVTTATAPAKTNVLAMVLQIVFVACLLALCGVLLWRRRKHAPGFADIEPTPIDITPVDEQLKEKAIRIVEEHMSNADFSVEQLSSALGMSRGHLYKRLLAITGKTPIEFIRTIRVKRGRQLLEESGEGVQQVAWHVGMSPKQFAKYFKEAYGALPSDFMRSRR